MVATFLQAEINSPRYAEQILAILTQDGRDRSVIDQPNLGNQADNDFRLFVLDAYRGYQKRVELFENFPTVVEWNRIVLNKADLLRAKYIAYDYWIELSGGSRM